jgi:hypothetical protein
MSNEAANLGFVLRAGGCTSYCLVNVYPGMKRPMGYAVDLKVPDSVQTKAQSASIGR